ncbi:MAG: leucine-rich repeat protein [Paludibacter sp.]|nr:leucine-rich repeat protein [Paludibacter sp.]
MKKIMIFITCIFVSLMATAQVSKTSHQVMAGTLFSSLTTNELATVTNLTLTGSIDARDVKTMRDDMPMLTVLDIRNVNIQAYTGNGTAGVLTYPANEMPQYSFCNSSTFAGKTTLKTITLASNLISIGKGAFRACCGLIGNLNLPESLTTIGEDAFYSCYGFTGTLIFPETLTSLGKRAFYNCYGFTGNLDIPNFVTSIEDDTFYDCIGFSGNLNLPDNLINIGNNAFYDCHKFTGSLIIPQIVATIGNAAFYNCYSFTGSLNLPNALTSIGLYAFTSCTGFTGSLNLPNSIKTIKLGAFENCSGFTGPLTLPNSLITIGPLAFLNCSSLTGPLTLSNSLTKIEDRTFEGCTQLNGKVIIPSSITSIGTAAFSNCANITALSFGENITSIGNFAFNGCSNLSNISLASNTPPTVFPNTFTNIAPNCNLEIPLSGISDYQGTAFWNSFSILNTELSYSANASAITDCPTCNLFVSSNSKLTIDVNKAYNSITLAPGAKLTLNNNCTLAGTLILQNNTTYSSSFVDENTSATSIVANVELNLPKTADRLWWYLASPVSGADWKVLGENNKVGEYIETNRNYSNPFNTDKGLTAGKGYVVKMANAAAAANYVFANKILNTGNINITLTRTITQTANNSKRGFNLVGNPYPAYLDFNTAYLSSATNNLRPTIWYRTGTGTTMSFHTYNAISGIGSPATATRYIPPMQAFWVKVDKDPTEGTVSYGTLSLTNAMRLHNETETNNPLKAPAANNRQLIRLTVSNGSSTDETVILSHPSASDSFDLYDSDKMSNNDVNQPEIFSLVDSKELVINSVSEFSDGKQFALGFRPGLAGNYSISLAEYSNMDDIKLVLSDHIKNYDWILTPEDDYHFTSDALSTQTRFTLLLRVKGTVTDFEELKSKLKIYTVQDKIWIQSVDLEGITISVYNTLGQSIFHAKAQSNTLCIDHIFTPGVYIVKVNDQLRKINMR